jgi:hypothetical protein
MMVEKFAPYVSGEEEDGNGKSEPAAIYLSALVAIDTEEMKFDDVDDTVVVLSSVETEMYRIQQKGKK